MRAFAWLLLPLLLAAQEYIISYELTTQKSMVLNERFDISRAMTRSDRESMEICRFFIEEERIEGRLQYLYSKKEEILSCLFKNGVRLKGYEQLGLAGIESTAKLFIDPLRLIVLFKDDFVIIKKPDKDNQIESYR